MGENKLEQVEQSGEFRKSLYCAAFKTRKRKLLSISCCTNI